MHAGGLRYHAFQEILEGKGYRVQTLGVDEEHSVCRYQVSKAWEGRTRITSYNVCYTKLLREADFADPGLPLLDALVDSGLLASKGEARRLIRQNAVRVNGDA